MYNYYKIKLIYYFINVFTLYNLLINLLSIQSLSVNNTDLQYNDDNFNVTYTKIRRGVIFPGTLWCGLGNVAVNDDDVGFFSFTDRCCKAHDKCSIDEQYLHKTRLQAIVDFFTRDDSICLCDTAFRKCLRKVNTLISIKVGKLFFNILRPTCLTLDHPILACTKWQGIFSRRCLTYALNTSAPMTLYRRDNPFF